MASKPSTCCGKSAECICATCSCGKQPALQCNRDKAAAQNSVDAPAARGSRPLCSVRATAPPPRSRQPGGLVVKTGNCGCSWPSGPCDGSCNCSGSEDGAFDPSEHETDFTTKK